MKNNKLIDKGLYREALRETRIMGIVFAAVCIFSTIGTVISNMAGITDFGEIVRIDTSEFSSPSLLLIYLAAPLMALGLFGWVNTRKTADFYHSLPYKRECIYISGVAAILTWTTAVLFTSFAISTIAYSIFPKTFVFSMYSVVTSFFGYFAAIFLSMSAVSLAVSLTGTRFMNIFVSLLVLFVPRVFIEVIVSVFSSNSPVLVTSRFPTILTSDCNIVYAIVRNSLNFFGYSYTIKPVHVVYTFVLGAVYFVLAAFLFKRRKSESAHRASTTPCLQSVFRITFAAFLIVVTFPLINDGGFGIGYLIWYSIVVVLYFAIELITTRKWKNVLRSIPGLLIVLVVCLSVFFGSRASAALTLSFEPSADEIESVRILSDGIYSNGMGGDVDFGTWASDKASGVEIDDRAVAEIVANSLKTSNKLAADNSFAADDNSDLVSFSIRTSSGVSNRCLVVTNANIKKILTIAAGYEEYREKFTKLPDIGSSNVTTDCSGKTIELTSEIYEMLRDEVASKDFTLWHDFLKAWYDNSTIFLNAVVRERGKAPVILEIPVSPVIAPKTYEEIVKNYFYSGEKCKQFIDEFEKIIDKLEEDSIKSNSYSWAWGNFEVYFYDKGLENGLSAFADNNMNFDAYYDGNDYTANDDEGYKYESIKFGAEPRELFEMLKKEADSEFDINSYVYINIGAFLRDEAGENISYNGGAYFPITDKTEEYFRGYVDTMDMIPETYVVD